MQLISISKRHGLRAVLSLCGITTCLMPAVAPAQEVATLQPVVVTAQRVQQNIQDVPISVAALSSSQLQGEGVAALDQLGAKVPGVDIFQFGSQTTTTITIRGVSQNDFSDQNEPPVAVYEDGAYDSFIGGAGFNLFDVNRVEVLRGPQGTLFGRNATGGVVQVIDNTPTDAFQAYASLTGGQYGLERLDGAVSGPLSQDVSSRLSISATHETGYIRNTAGPTDDGTNNLSTRLQFDFRPSDAVDYLVNLHTVRDDVTGSVGYKTARTEFFPGVDNGLVHYPASFAEWQSFCQGFLGVTPPPGSSDCFGFVDPKPGDPWTVSHNTPGYMDRTEYGATGTLTWHLGPAVTLTNITDYRRLRRNYLEDTDGTPEQQSTFNFYSDMNSWQLSNEARLAGKTGSVNWQTGIYYLDIQHHILDGINADTGLSPLTDFYTANTVKQSTNSYSVFGQADWHFASRWTFTLGGRYIEDRKHMNIEATCLYGGCTTFGFTAPGILQGAGFNSTDAPGLTHERNGMVAGKVELDWRPVDGLLLYGMVDRGTKGGGFNAAGLENIPIDRTPYKPETLTDYELGLKSTFFDRRAQLDASAYYYDYHNYQAYTLIGFSPLVFNSDALNRGGELSFHVLPARGLDISLGAAYENAVVKNVPLQFPAGPFMDQRPPQSPRLTENLTVQQTWMLPSEAALVFEGTVNHVGQRYFNTINDPVLSDAGYTTENLRLTLESPGDRWELGLWIDNLTNTQYILTAFDLSTTNGVVTRVYAPPRQIGGTLTYHFQ